MRNLIMKLIMLPIVVVIASNLLTTVNFPYVRQPIILGVTLAVTGHLLEWAILSERTFWLTLIVDFVTATITVYILGYFFTGAQVTFMGAILTAALISVLEYFVHMWLIRTRRARKEPVYE